MGNTDADYEKIFEGRVAEKQGISGLYVLTTKTNEVIATVNLGQGRGTSEHALYIGGLAVKQDASGSGIGMDLMKKIEQIAKDHGIIRLELDVEEDNFPAIGLYSKMGFEKEGARIGFVKRLQETHYVNEIAMGKILEKSN